MQFVVFFEDNPDAPPDIRPRFMADHLGFLSRNPQITDAGPLSDRGRVFGGLWLVEAEDEAEVQRLIEADPFWPTGLRDTHRILGWRKVFAGGQPV